VAAAYALLAVRWILALTLLGTGISKVFAPSAFAESVRRYDVVPSRYSTPVAWTVIAGELLLGVGFSIGLAVPVCGALAAALFLCFAAAIGWNLSRGRSFDCGCVAGERPISWRLAGADVALGGLGVWVAIGPSGALALWAASSGSGGLGLSRALPIPMIIVTLVGLWRLIEQGAWLRHGEESVIETPAPGLNVIKPGAVGQAFGITRS
jgi:uncharacterized membrane protein YphA (DoxX/SURF4 family)